MNIRTISKNKLSSRRGFSTVELLIVVVIILIVITYTLTTVVRGQKPALRSNAARQLANYLEQARNDSIRRRATKSSQMAQVTVLNEKYYSVMMDANGDGALDTPVVISLADQRVTLNGPFPRTFIFDLVGKPVDSSANAIQPEPINITNSSGVTTVKLSDAGQPPMVQP
jgi:prepilin-type N-terminal cleavage/methylation domain-containing protein